VNQTDLCVAWGQRLGHVLAVYEPPFSEYLADVRAHAPAGQCPTQFAQDRKLGQPHYQMERGNVGVIRISGVLSKYPSVHQYYFGGTAATVAQKSIEMAAADDSVRAIALLVDSPGGSSAGIADLADAIYAARQRKRVIAYASDLMASAAYMVASQADVIYGNLSAMVGSIGTYGVIYDWSAYFAEAGVKVHVIRAGQFKGAGTFGTEITPEQLSEWQREIDQLNAVFLGIVGRGRPQMAAKLDQLADGRVHVGPAAVNAGLIDGLKDWNAVLAELGDESSARVVGRSSVAGATAEETTMANADAPAGPAPVTLAELSKALPDLSADQKLYCLEHGYTLEQATQYALDQKRLELQQREAEIKRLKAAAASPGVQPLGTRGDAETSAQEVDGDPVAKFDELVAQHMQRNGGDRWAAVASVSSAHPELHQAYLSATANTCGKTRRVGRR